MTWMNRLSGDIRCSLFIQYISDEVKKIVTLIPDGRHENLRLTMIASRALNFFSLSHFNEKLFSSSMMICHVKSSNMRKALHKSCLH